MYSCIYMFGEFYCALTQMPIMLEVTQFYRSYLIHITFHAAKVGAGAAADFP